MNPSNDAAQVGKIGAARFARQKEVRLLSGVFQKAVQRAFFEMMQEQTGNGDIYGFRMGTLEPVKYIALDRIPLCHDIGVELVFRLLLTGRMVGGPPERRAYFSIAAPTAFA